MPINSPIFLPIVILAGWTMIIWFWMYITRLPAMFSMKMKLDSHAPRGEQMSTLPSTVRWKADNYNHLMEQPTIFYAVALVLAVMGHGDGINAKLAWAYVLLRVVHSLVQTLINKIQIRFLLFILSSFALIGLVVNALKILL